ncbi:MAG: MoaD/ThiS family protein [Rhodanobacter sp.]
MTEVRVGGALRAYAGGQEVFEVGGANIRELLADLGTQCPKLKPFLDKGVAVVIDGELYRDAWFQPVGPDSEVYILPRVAGG